MTRLGRGAGVASAGAGAREGDAVRAEEPVGAGGSRAPSSEWPESCLGVFGGLAGTNQPLGSLGAAAASTVIGLTTGLFGTAQISLAITAAEQRGEAKTVATPRVTALNNRPAQIESGSQIPVQTTQAASGTAVVTTTFVSVPLRLSITPQITDAGTVILRVTIENNTINTGIAVGGVPGIDTQRMQTEVLVPDGGTTVMGGVLADTEGTTRQRTPGLASIPVVGNLFKRKLVTKQSSEIFFFITPRIYRPDYHGKPITGTISNAPRTIQISQPVPLGNPQSNTPTPTQLQQQQTAPQNNQGGPQMLTCSCAECPWTRRYIGTSGNAERSTPVRKPRNGGHRVQGRIGKNTSSTPRAALVRRSWVLHGIAVERSLKEEGQDANLDVAAAEFTSLVRNAQRAGKDTGLGGLRELVVSLDDAVLLVRLLSQEYFVVLAISP